MNIKKAVSFIEENGILLVYPLQNRKEPQSLWSCFFPRSTMSWEWDESGDQRVSDLWHLRSELSSSQKVAYAKWYQGRATFFSRSVFTSLLSILGSTRRLTLSPQAHQILELLQSDSPLSTKQIKAQTDLKGRLLEGIYTRAMKELWMRLLIVGTGEIDDGAFPSLAVSSTQLVFEDLWTEARERSPEKERIVLDETLQGEAFKKYLHKIDKQLQTRTMTMRSTPLDSGPKS